MRSRLSFLILSISFLVNSVNAQEDVSKSLGLTPMGKSSLDYLLTAKKFEDKHVGYSGALSKSVAAYLEVLKEQNRVAAFRLLLEEGSKVGQLYALIGLYDVDYAYFLVEIERFKPDPFEVDSLSGCIGSRSRVRDIVFIDRPDTIRFKDRYETYEEWAIRTNNNGTFSIDIFGGGFSWAFRGHDLKRP